MKANRSAQKTLAQFASLSDFFLIVPPCRFLVFGEGKRGAYRGIAVEGFLNQSFAAPKVYSFPALKDGQFEPFDAGYDPLMKVDDFNQLIAAPVQTRFFLDRESLKLIRRQDARRNTHIRFFKKPDGHTTARVFDARKYYSSAIDTDLVDDYAEIQMPTDAASDFYFYVELTILKKMPIDDYEVTVLEDEMVTFEGVESGLSFHLRDQRLGEQMEERIADLGSYDEVFFIDIDRMKPSSADWKAPNAKRRKSS